jgi:hypothetical protein
MGLLFKGSHLDLIHERLFRALFLLGRFFRNDHAYRGDTLFHNPHTIRRGFGEIDDTAFFVCVWPTVCDLDFRLFPCGAIFDHDFGAQGEMAVGGCHLILRESVSISCLAAMETLPIVGGQAVFPVPVIRTGGGTRHCEHKR